MRDGDGSCCELGDGVGMINGVVWAYYSDDCSCGGNGGGHSHSGGSWRGWGSMAPAIMIK